MLIKEVRKLVPAAIACAVVTHATLVGPAAQGEPATVRLDYFHRGGPGGERIEFDRVMLEGPWPGSLTQPIDSSGLGKFFFEVIERPSGRVIFSRGFASAFGEWETTPEFKKANRFFHESLRFPRPQAPVRVVIKKRNSQNVFEELWTTDLDPRVMWPPDPGDKPAGRVSSIVENGPPARRVDLLFISEGYSSSELSKFRSDAARLVDVLFSLEPFSTRRSDFNVHLVEVEGAPVSVGFNVFGLERYALAEDNRALRNIAALAPYDVITVLVNQAKYGGGGIFNQQSTVAASNDSADYLFVHELAHNLAGLGDEYVGSVTYETGGPIKTEPWEPNVTALHDPLKLKWRDLVDPGTPIPTPLSHAGKVGAFEGAGYEARGLYRPEAECIMGGARKLTSFCRVCRRAIDRMIDFHIK